MAQNSPQDKARPVQPTETQDQAIDDPRVADERLSQALRPDHPDREKVWREAGRNAAAREPRRKA